MVLGNLGLRTISHFKVFYDSEEPLFIMAISTDFTEKQQYLLNKRVIREALIYIFKNLFNVWFKT